MPLYTSPIDGSPMRQVNRHGVEIDVCPTSGGVWLDRGELEKIIALMRAEILTKKAGNGDAGHDPERHFGAEEHRRSSSERPGKLEMLMDIFDF